MANAVLTECPDETLSLELVAETSEPLLEKDGGSWLDEPVGDVGVNDYVESYYPLGTRVLIENQEDEIAEPEQTKPSEEAAFEDDRFATEPFLEEAEPVARVTPFENAQVFILPDEEAEEELEAESLTPRLLGQTFSLPALSGSLRHKRSRGGARGGAGLSLDCENLQTYAFFLPKMGIFAQKISFYVLSPEKILPPGKFSADAHGLRSKVFCICSYGCLQ